MSSKKRKNIKRERRRVQESEITFKWHTGDELTPELADTMYQFYARTIAYYGAQSYLNKRFYQYLSNDFKHKTLFLFAYHQDQIIAGGLYFKSKDTLYGRYWGALANFHSVHFETCYKLARGLEPKTTYSTHWIKHPEFQQAIGNFIKDEQQHIEDYSQSMQSHSPFKKGQTEI